MSERPVAVPDVGWRGTLLGALVAVQALTSVRLWLARPPTEAKPDVLAYLHYGWYVTRGAVPYADFWDPKPPLVHETSALLAVVAGGDPLALYVLGVVVTGAAAVLAAYVAARLVFVETGDRRAALLTGAAVYTFAGFHLLAAGGYRPKYFAALGGVLGLYLVRTDRPLAGGAAAAAAAAFWQPAVVFPALAVGVHAVERRWRDAGRVVLGGAATAAAVVAPFVVWWDLHALVGATVLAPLASSDGVTPLTLVRRVYHAPLVLGYGTLVVVAAAVGAVQLLREDWRETWWLAAGTGWFALQLLALDFDGAGDLVLGFPFLAVVAGRYYATLPAGHRRVGRGAVAAALAVSVVTLGGVGVVFAPAHAAGGPTVTEDGLYRAAGTAVRTTVLGVPALEPAANASPPGDRPTIAEVYWEQRRPDRCFYWVNKQARSYVERTNSTINQTECTYPR